MNFEHLQKEKGEHLFIYLFVNKWFYITNALSDRSEVSRLPYSGHEMVRRWDDKNWLQHQNSLVRTVVGSLQHW